MYWFVFYFCWMGGCEVVCVGVMVVVYCFVGGLWCVVVNGFDVG